MELLDAFLEKNRTLDFKTTGIELKTTGIDVKKPGLDLKKIISLLPQKLVL